jgi:hypothetical protein
LGVRVTRRLERDHLVAADAGPSIRQRARHCSIDCDRSVAAVEHDEIVAEAVHLEKRDLAHCRCLYGRLSFLSNACPAEGVGRGLVRLDAHETISLRLVSEPNEASFVNIVLSSPRSIRQHHPDLAKKHGLARFRVGYFYSEVGKDVLRRRIVAGHEILGLDGRPPLDLVTLDATERVVAMAGIHPYIKLLDDGADVIVGGRSSDCAIFAAPAIRQGFPEGLAYFYGKVLKCASFCAEPYGGKESVLGEITIHDVKITAL